MQYQGIIFDLDGVLCHTDQYHYQAWKMVADQLGIYFDEAINHRLRGVSRMQSLEIILERYDGQLSTQEKQRYAQQKNEQYRHLLANITPRDLAPETHEVLQTLRAAGLLLAIGSSSKNAQYILERIGLSNYFDAVVDGNQIQYSKPDPQVFLLAAKAINRPPEEVLVVEDAVAGVQAAIAGGMQCAAIGDAAKANIAQYNIHTLAELVEICGIPMGKEHI